MSKTIEIATTFKYLDHELPEIDVLLNINQIIRATYRPTQIYRAELLNFEEHFQPDKLLPVIRTLAEAGDLRSPNVREAHIEHFKTIKKARKAMILVGDAWLFLDESHSAPDILKKVSGQLGEFKDRVIHLAPATRNTDTLLKALAEFTATGLPPLTPANYITFAQKYHQYLDEIYTYFRRPKLTLDKYHRLRRRVRSLMHYYSMVSKSIDVPELARLAKYLDPVSSEMGIAQDQLFVMEHDGEVNPNRDTTIIADRHRKIIETLISLHNN